MGGPSIDFCSMLRPPPSLDGSPVEADGSERDPEVNRPREESETVTSRGAHLGGDNDHGGDNWED